MKDLFPTLNNQTEVPKLIDDIVKAGGRGSRTHMAFTIIQKRKQSSGKKPTRNSALRSESWL
jgi:hypothetical protein